MSLKDIQKDVWRFLNFEVASTGWARATKIALLGLILLNMLAVICGTVPSFEQRHGPWLYAFECFSVAVFTVEYLLRLWSCAADSTGQDRDRRWVHIRRPEVIVDLIAILPFYLSSFLSLDLRFLRGVRLLRLPRIIKPRLIGETMRNLKEGLRASTDEILYSVYAVVIFLVMGSSLLYFVEARAASSQIRSIPAAMWWLVDHLTFADTCSLAPVTPAGKCLGMLLMFIGIGGVFLFPLSVFSSAVSAKAQEQPVSDARSCPHCGRRLNGAKEELSDGTTTAKGNNP
jgi:voltage-gated potassium channel